MRQKVETAKRAAVLFVPAALITVGVLIVLFGIQDNASRELAEATEARTVDQARLTVLSSLSSAAADVRYLAAQPPVGQFLERHDPVDRSEVAEDLLTFAATHPGYDQIRLIDEAGREIVRVDRSEGQSQVVADTDLQDKAGRPYVTETLKLERGAVYQSALDLNVEHGVVEEPLKPTIRFATPIFGQDGRKRGLVVVNYLGTLIIDQVRALNEGRVGKLAMLNGDGYWLLGPKPEDEWAFMFPGRQAASFAGVNPEAWRKIRDGAPADNFYIGDDLYTYVRLSAAADPKPAVTTGTGPANPLVLVSARAGSAVSATIIELRRTRLIGASAFLLLLAFVSWLVARHWTARRKSEEAISELNQDLKFRNVELENLNKELESFSYSVSHDLRAPLRAIDGFSQALMEDAADKLDPVSKTYLKRIRAAAQRMGELIDDMIKLARVTRAEVAVGTVDLSALAEEIAGGLKESAPERHGSFTIAPDLVAASDLRLMRVALENLLHNAWKFTSRRDNTEIEFGRAGVNGEAAYFVRDNGAGFDMQYAGKLFGAFQRLHDAGSYPGTGIGLATVQRIIRKHGGRIWAEARPDHGATFYFTLAA